MLGFEIGTCRFGRFYKGIITKNFAPKVSKIFKKSKFLYTFRYKVYKNIAYDDVPTRHLWISSRFVSRWAM